MSSSASYSGRRYGSTFACMSPGRKPSDSPASTAGRASTMRRTRLRDERVDGGGDGEIRLARARRADARPRCRCRRSSAGTRPARGVFGWMTFRTPGSTMREVAAAPFSGGVPASPTSRSQLGQAQHVVGRERQRAAAPRRSSAAPRHARATTSSSGSGDGQRVATQRHAHAEQTRCSSTRFASFTPAKREQVGAFGGEPLCGRLVRGLVPSAIPAPPGGCASSRRSSAGTGDRRALEQRAGRRRLGKGDHVAQRGSAGQQHRDAVEAEARCRRAAARRRAAPRAGSRSAAPAPSHRRCRAARTCATARAGR